MSLPRILMLLGRVALGLVFLYAAYTKLRQPCLLFAISIDSYRLLPEQAVLLLARVIPWLELALGVLLITGYRLAYVASVATALLLVFMGVMIRAYGQGLGIDCGCFGVGEALSLVTLARDGAPLLISIAITIAAFRTSKPATVAYG